MLRFFHDNKSHYIKKKKKEKSNALVHLFMFWLPTVSVAVGPHTPQKTADFSHCFVLMLFFFLITALSF